MAITERMPLVNDPEAHGLLKAAHESGYRFPSEFAGFSSDIEISVNGETRRGHVVLRSPRDLDLDIEADEATMGWVRHEIGSMVGHRWPTPYAESDGRWILTLEEEAAHPLGQLIKVHDDPFDSSYRLRDGRITQVNRHMGPTRFSINIHEHALTADGRTLPSAFTVAFWNTEEGRLTRTDAYQDRYVEIGGIQVPEKRRILRAEDSCISVHEMMLSNYTLL